MARSRAKPGRSFCTSHASFLSNPVIAFHAFANKSWNLSRRKYSFCSGRTVIMALIFNPSTTAGAVSSSRPLQTHARRCRRQASTWRIFGKVLLRKSACSLPKRQHCTHSSEIPDCAIVKFEACLFSNSSLAWWGGIPSVRTAQAPCGWCVHGGGRDACVMEGVEMHVCLWPGAIYKPGA